MRLVVLSILLAIVLAEQPAATEAPVEVVEAVPVAVPVPVSQERVPLNAVPIPASDSGASTEAVLNALSRTRQELSDSLTKQSKELSASLDAVEEAQRTLLKEVATQKLVSSYVSHLLLCILLIRLEHARVVGWISIDLDSCDGRLRQRQIEFVFDRFETD